MQSIETSEFARLTLKLLSFPNQHPSENASTPNQKRISAQEHLKEVKA